jgi:hypothetical protein
MKPYYYVHRVGYKSTVKHYTLESAHKEALRLSEQHKSDVFEILQCIGLVRTVQPQVFWMDGVKPAHLGPTS